VRNLILTRFV